MSETLQAGMSIESISGLPAWKALSPTVKRVLTLYFEDETHNLVDAVAKAHNTPHLTHLALNMDLNQDSQEQIAANLLANEDVHTLIDLFFGKAQSTFSHRPVSGFTPSMTLDELKTNPSWRRLDLKFQTILTVCFAETNCSIVEAVAKFNPTSSLELQVDMARRILENASVQAVISLYVFGFDLAAAQKVAAVPAGLEL